MRGQGSTPPLRLAIAGTGRIAQVAHLPAAGRCAGVRLVGLFDPRADLAAKVAAAHGGVAVYPTLEALLSDGTIDALLVSVPTPQHEAVVAAALSAGKHVLVEKPLALTSPAARRLPELAQQSGRRLMVGYHKRYEAACVQAHGWMPEIGEVTHALYRFSTTNWLSPAGAPVFTRVASSLPDDSWPWPASANTVRRQQFYAVCLDMFSHMTNLLRWLTGCRPRVEWVRTSPEIEKRDGTVRAMLALAFRDTPAMLIEGPHYAVDHGWNERCELWGRAGRIELELPPHVDSEARARGRLWTAATGKITEATTAGRWAFEEQLAHFAHAVATGEPFRTEARDAVIDVELAEEALEKLGCSSA